MKRYLCTINQTIIFLLITFSVKAQSTWITTTNLDFWLPNTTDYDSVAVRPYEICVTPNGNILSLVQINQDKERDLVALDPNGNILWKKQVGTYHGTSEDNSFRLYPTYDNGCTYIFRHESFGQRVDYTINRLDSNGNIKWTLSHGYQFGFPGKDVIALIPTYNKHFYLQFTDSLVELDSNGVSLNVRNPFTGSISIIPDSDFIVSDPLNIIREDFSGNQTWSINSNGFGVATSNEKFLYLRNASEVTKINTFDGSVIWNKPITTNIISETSDSGFIALRGSGLSVNEIAKFDYNGNMQWSKIFSFPEFGFKVIHQTNQKQYVTGGCWKNRYLIQPHRPVFSPFIMQIDSLGNGVIDSTDYFYIGNANDNSRLSFADDAVYIAAAMQNSGTVRGPYLHGDNINTYGTDWPGSFNIGYNYKYSDFDGNGVIDTADIRIFSQIFIYNNNNVTPHWRQLENSSSLPPISFSFENNTQSYSDTIKVNVILGSNSMAIDSIYGLSFDLKFDLFHSVPNSYFQSYSIKPSGLGDTLNNLFSFMSLNPGGVPPITSMVLCRTDQTNAFVAGDTIVTLFFVLPPNSIHNDTARLSIEWNAITQGGYPISLNLISDTLFLLATTGINETKNTSINIYPNPANNQIVFSFESENTNELNIFDNSGRKILSVSNPGKKYILNVKDFAEGLYYVSSLSSNKISRSKFLVVH